MNVEISKLIESGAEISISVNANQLKTFAMDILKEYTAQTKQPQAETYVTINKASELLGVDRTTLWRWNKENYLKSIKIGGKTLYKQSDIDRILQK